MQQLRVHSCNNKLKDLTYTRLTAQPNVLTILLVGNLVCKNLMLFVELSHVLCDNVTYTDYTTRVTVTIKDRCRRQQFYHSVAC